MSYYDEPYDPNPDGSDPPYYPTDPNTNPPGGPNPPPANTPPADPNAITRQQVLDAYYAFTGRTPDQVSEDEIQGATHHPGGLGALTDFMRNSPEGQAYTHRERPPSGPPPAGGGGAAPTGPNLTDPWGRTFSPPGDLDTSGGLPYIPKAPTFTGPAFPNIPKFAAPTAEEALNDDGYKFVVKQGSDGLQNWAAARGTLNDSSTAKGLEDYNQNAATTQYANVWNRKFQGYQSDVENQYLRPWEAQYNEWLNGTVGPGMTAWQTMASAGQHANDVRQTNARNDYRFDWDVFRDQRDSTWDKVFKWATA